MAARSDGHHEISSDNDGASSQPLTEQPTTFNTEKHRFANTSTQTLQQTLNQPSLPSSNQLPHIPLDLISRILLKLPVKSLLRFRSVCKSWNALISDPKFAREQFHASPVDPTQSTRNHLILFFRNRSYENICRDFSLTTVFSGSVASSSQQRHLPHSVQGKVFRFLAESCHGMLLLCYSNCPFLWNPATGKSKKLPPLEYSLAYGLGYDCSSDVYKVVAVVNRALIDGDDPEWDPRVMVHTLGTDSWREIQGFPVSVYLMSCAGKFVSGALHWLAVDNSRGDLRVIVCLELLTETYHQLLLPPECQGNHTVLSYQVLKGHLGILSHHKRNWDVWLMKEYGNKESWTKVFSYSNNVGFEKYIPWTTSLLSMSDDDNELLLQSTEEVFVYNSKSGTFRTITGMQSFRCLIVGTVYTESLIWL